MHLPAPTLLLAVAEYGIVGILLLVGVGLAAVIFAATHLIGPRRHGARKESTYESGMEPVGDARRRFNVRFYLVAVMYLVFGMEVVFFYPGAVLLPRFNAPAGSPHHEWARTLTQAGFGPGYFLAVLGVFFVLLLVGFVYEWRKGIFRWE